MNRPANHSTSSSDARLGVVYGLSAYLMWGVVPLYFRLIRHVPPLTVLAHRIVWTVLLMALLVAWRKGWGEVVRAASKPRTLVLLSLSTVVIAINWLVFIWAIASARVMQASLGYYINPFVSVLLGVMILGERLRGGQVAGLVMASIGVAVIAIHAAAAPWVALALATSFGLYGLLRKLAAVSPVVGLTIETTLLLPLAALVLFIFPPSAGRWDGVTWGLLAAAGVVTAIPLLLFAAAANRLRLATLGFMQYVAPTCQFLLAVAFGEPLTAWHLAGFACIWVAIALYTWDVARRRAPEAMAPTAADPSTAGMAVGGGS